MKVQKTGPDSVLLVLNVSELQDENELRRRAREALASEGIPAGETPEMTAYTAGGKAVVFVCAGERHDTYFGFDTADDLMDAACEAERLFPKAGASLRRADGRFYLTTDCRHAAELLREYASVIAEDGRLCENSEVILAQGAFQILSGRC